MDAQKAEVVTRKQGPQSPRQAVLIVVVATLLWVPMILFLIFGLEKYSPGQIGPIALVNLVAGVSILILAYRKWISRM
jgi:hypothetical protein